MYRVTTELTVPRLIARGSDSPATGLCALQLVSWEQGEDPISDFPQGVDYLLARIVQQINDECCSHTKDDLLCPKCSMRLLDLAHRCVRTAPVGRRPWWDAKHTYIEVGLALARSIERFADDPRRVKECNDAVHLWVGQYSDDMCFPWIATSIDQADELAQAGCWVAQSTLNLLIAMTVSRTRYDKEVRWSGTESIYDLFDSSVIVQQSAVHDDGGLYIRQGEIAVRAFHDALDHPPF